MIKYICSVCGYVYDEVAGIPDSGIPRGTKWEDLPIGFTCPLCGAAEDEFELENKKAPDTSSINNNAGQEPKGMSFAAMSVLCSNLAKGCEKQYKNEEKELYQELADYFKDKAGIVGGVDFEDIEQLIASDLAMYSDVSGTAKQHGDRGALRALAWGEKVAKIQSSVLKRYEKGGSAVLDNKNIYVCEICGFVYIGDASSEICPICKVPKLKITQVRR